MGWKKFLQINNNFYYRYVSPKSKRDMSECETIAWEVIIISFVFIESSFKDFIYEEKDVDGVDARVDLSILMVAYEWVKMLK